MYLNGCTAPGLWQCDSMITGHPIFNSIKLTYSDPLSSPLQFELIRTHTSTESFLNLTKYQFNPSLIEINAQFTIDEEVCEAKLPILEGKMRLKLSSELTKQLVNALKNKKEVIIMVDGFVQNVRSDQFPYLYEQFDAKPSFLSKPLKKIFQS